MVPRSLKILNKSENYWVLNNIKLRIRILTQINLKLRIKIRNIRRELNHISIIKDSSKCVIRDIHRKPHENKIEEIFSQEFTQVLHSEHC